VHKTQNEGKQENKKITQKILMISNTTLQYKTGVNRGDRECKQFLILKKKSSWHALIVKSGKCLIGDRGQKASSVSVQKQDRNDSNTFLPVYLSSVIDSIDGY
jgi:hypothetical protein